MSVAKEFRYVGRGGRAVEFRRLRKQYDQRVEIAPDAVIYVVDRASLGANLFGSEGQRGGGLRAGARVIDNSDGTRRYE